MSPHDDRPSKRAELLADAEEILEAFARTLSKLSNDCTRGAASAPTIDEAFRHIHSLKGLSGLIGLDALVRLSHALETLLDCLRLDRVVLSDGILDLLSDA